MGKSNKRISRLAALGGHAKDRHKKSMRTNNLATRNPAPVKNLAPSLYPTVLNARKEVPKINSKHHSYYELVENKDKKKKLEFKVTSDRDPPPGFEFVPTGNPELTKACKEISREQDAMIFIVSTDKKYGIGTLSHQVNRVGHHIRQTIVEQARAAIGENEGFSGDQHPPDVPEPIPETQEEINEQADKAIRDLFPRIPNTDRQMIIELSFKKGATKKGGPLVGLAPDITLSRRVQLAVLAHIRHIHTRYDELLKETTYANARKAVEALCLDKLVKWRGDEETGRDQLDEILREVIVISDSDGEGDDDDSDRDGDDDDEEDEEDAEEVESSDTASTTSSVEEISRPITFVHDGLRANDAKTFAAVSSENSRYRQDAFLYEQRLRFTEAPGASPYLNSRPFHDSRLGVKKARRGFKRYQAALNARWDEARDRVRLQGANDTGRSEASFTSLASHAAPGRYEPQHAEPQYHSATPVYRNVQETTAMEQRDSSKEHHYETKVPQRIFSYVEHALQASSSSSVTQPKYAYDARHGGPLPTRQESTPGPIPMAYRSLSSSMSRHSSAFARSHHPSPAPISMVRSDEAQDFLVPSVEPVSSPPVGSSSSAPAFVHTASTRPPSQAWLEAPQEPSDHYRERRHSPQWGGEDQLHAKRRRVTNEEAGFIQLPPREADEHRFPSRSGPAQSQPVLYRTEVLPHATPGWEDDRYQQTARQYVREDGWNQEAAEPLAYPTAIREPTLFSNRHNDAHGQNFRDSPSRPTAMNDWPSRPPPSSIEASHNNYRRPYDSQAYRMEPTEYSPKRRNHADGGTVHHRLLQDEPPRSAPYRNTENHEPYGLHVPATNGEMDGRYSHHAPAPSSVPTLQFQAHHPPPSSAAAPHFGQQAAPIERFQQAPLQRVANGQPQHYQRPCLYSDGGSNDTQTLQRLDRKWESLVDHEPRTHSQNSWPAPNFPGQPNRGHGPPYEASDIQAAQHRFERTDPQYVGLYPSCPPSPQRPSQFPPQTEPQPQPPYPQHLQHGWSSNR